MNADKLFIGPVSFAPSDATQLLATIKSDAGKDIPVEITLGNKPVIYTNFHVLRDVDTGKLVFFNRQHQAAYEQDYLEKGLVYSYQICTPHALNLYVLAFILKSFGPHLKQQGCQFDVPTAKAVLDILSTDNPNKPRITEIIQEKYNGRLVGYDSAERYLGFIGTCAENAIKNDEKAKEKAAKEKSTSRALHDANKAVELAHVERLVEIQCLKEKI